MKILTVVVNLNKGGTQRAAQSFAEAYSILGYDSRILALYELGPRYNELKDTIPVWNTLNEVSSISIKKWNPEIVHIHSHGPKKKDILKVIHLCDKSKIIETNVFSTPSPWASLIDISFQLSEWGQWLFNMRGGAKFNTEILPNPINCKAFKKASNKDVDIFKKKHKIPKDAFIIGRIGQAIKGKWSIELLNVFNKVSTKIPNTYLLLINPPETILNKAALSPFKNNIIHIPKIFGDQNLSVAYSTMDVMLLIAEQGESFGIVSPESILCETPVVTLNTPWGDNSQSEVIGNKKGGFVLNNKMEISNIIINIKQNKLKYYPEIGIEHVNQYNHITVAKKAVEYALANVKNKQIKKNNNIVKVLNNSMDKPNKLTILFIMLNINIFRLLTIYTSGYKGIREMRASIYNIFIKKFLKQTFRFK